MKEDVSWSFESEDQQRVDRLLAAYLAEAKAKSVFLLDRAGRLLTLAGSVDAVDRASFASLAAADFAASDQLAELLGEEEFSALYHQGAGQSMILADIGGRAILATLFDDRSTLGLVRLRTRTLIPDLGRIIDVAVEREKTRPRGGFLESGWATEAADEIDRLFTE